MAFAQNQKPRHGEVSTVFPGELLQAEQQLPGESVEHWSEHQILIQEGPQNRTSYPLRQLGQL
jgi:hypothetical protein